uniref:Pimeloyl-[acyl-carrier protein] methyl ester esterase n=1 Tax=Candidatus Kentrum eta TaxID=2126337 RepID=A0A450UEA3_9GAMM|nr:MAG: pimeloyl-[acyl-carrier protein] methyl ester esterase [Candidatus Kentron sp. H]VFK02689.1 MAG: pimeloyl-[acyl-carrier protein] methyl ester esterase [Candidatus Kentron sp. H]VFK05779.1 MAG: pimeloyl-[acyl-carrier protein] methyl ester esterase [Candidatus Kentron sp. H]
MSLPAPLRPPPKHLVAIHGWGFNSAVWEDTGRQLADEYRLRAVDLPGFGKRPMPAGEYTLPTLADSVVEAAPEPSVMMGWSLGGLVALEVARRYPERTRALVMVASSPRFTKAGDWPHGVTPGVLNAFSQTVTSHRQHALVRFLIIQAGRTDLGRITVNKLKPLLFRDGVPDQAALERGLILLRETDYRDVLPTIRCPVLFILGSRDNLLSSAVAEDLESLCRDCRVAVIKGSAHAPFISHPAAFLQVLKPFLEQV